ncbi:hypothetical protein [Flagellimonas zhangzhouensis]|uniref:Uncharacterized protein n=1 Tax=Flagellimonas zhangzhouensis TaxID=1073328 RepID=A0A1H2WSW9_9FLAO|nr:hypothetical protein [Allomuricauda zhangzhouensis]SDQ23907.1 hypothetical protein SAMN05216294_1018 [Allomuricauda zhangzhouensis]SDW83069.1 hypothetical protein SAMN04487892_2398 [Allomuricauda zhangzhouensis]
MDQSDEYFWNILNQNEKYLLDENDFCNGHEYILRLSFQLSTLSNEEYLSFIDILFKKFHNLFTIKHITALQLYAISNNFFEMNGNYTCVFDNSKRNFEGIYDNVFLSTYRDFRWSIIRGGKQHYNTFLENPHSILELLETINVEVTDSLFRIPTLVNFYKDLNRGWKQEFNSGTILSKGWLSVVEEHKSMVSISYNGFKENINDIKNNLTDYTNLHMCSNAMEMFNKSDQDFILKAIRFRENLDTYEDLFR